MQQKQLGFIGEPVEMDLVEGFSNELTYWQRIDAIIFVGRRPGCTQ